MGSKSKLCGKASSGQAVKICNNLLLAITMIGLSETIGLAKSLNLDLNHFYEVISESSGSVGH